MNIIHKYRENEVYAINSMLYLRTIKEKHIEIYNKFISQLHIYAKVIRMLAKGYLPISLITPLKLIEILTLVKETLTKSNPDYNIVIKTLQLYYDMKILTFGIDGDRNLIIQFPIFVQTHTAAVYLTPIRNNPSIDCRQKY